MTDIELRAFLDLLMCSDPSPVTEDQDKILRDFADRESQRRGFSEWIDAYHRLGR